MRFCQFTKKYIYVYDAELLTLHMHSCSLGYVLRIEPKKLFFEKENVLACKPVFLQLYRESGDSC